MENNVAILENKIKSLGVSDFGYADMSAYDSQYVSDLPNAISIVVRLSDYVLDEIDKEPTFAYFQHYRTVNAFIDNAILQIGLTIQNMGYKYMPIAASQSIPTKVYAGLISHKAAARIAGLGSIGKQAAFISDKFGPRVRLGTILTNMPLPVKCVKENIDVCGDCKICTSICPAMAIVGNNYKVGMQRSELFDAKACSNYMKEHFMHIGRGSVCGLCIRYCPKGMKHEVENER